MKTTLPIEVHDHFSKANTLHSYVQKSTGEAIKHALATGLELTQAKAAVPHGRWESECERLFDGSLRTAQFYMQFATHYSKLKSAQKSALLLLEGTLEGAAKAAKQAASPPKPAPVEIDEDAPPAELGPQDWQDPPEPEEEPESGEQVGNNRGTIGEHLGNTEPDPKPITAKTGREKDVWEAKQVLKTWADAVGRWMNGNPAGIDVYRDKFPGPKGDRVIEAAKELWNAVEAWRKVIK